jgi:hypothetical protein
MAAADIIARLRLNGEAFVSDTKATFSAFNKDVVASAGQARSAFDRSFTEIQALARSALQAPRTAGGALDLNVNGVREAAAEARNNAVAQRELATAYERAAASANDTSEATHLEVTAARAAAIAAEDHAKSLEQQARSLGLLQAELGKSATAVRGLYDEQIRLAQAEVEARRVREAADAVVTSGLSGKSASASAAVFEEQARAAEQLEDRVRSLRTAVDPLWAAQQRYNSAQADARDLISRGAITLDDYSKREVQLQGELEQTTTRIRQQGTALREGSTSAAQHRASVQDLGFQISDFGTQVLGGTSPIRAFAQQSGQAAFALSGMGGAAGRVGTFLAGPYGAAILIAVSAMAEFLPALLDGTSELDRQEKALEAVAKGADAFGEAETLLGKVIDLTTGKLKTHNQVLVETVKLQAQVAILSAQKDLKKGTDGLSGLAKPTFGETLQDSMVSMGGLYGATAQMSQRLQEANAARSASLKPLADTFSAFAKIANDPTSSPEAIGSSLKTVDDTIDKLASSGKLAGRNLIDVKTGLAGVATAAQTIIANKQALSVLNGGPIPDDLKPYKRDPKPKKPKKIADPTGSIDALMNEAQGDIDQYGDAPTFLAKANLELAKLQQGLEKLDKIKQRSPLDVERIAKARDLLERAGATIRESLDKPYADFIRQQRDAFEVQKLLASGRTDEAEALRTVISLEKQMGPLTAERKQGVLDTVEALRAEQRQVEINREKLQEYSTALASTKSAIEGVFTNGVEGAKALPKQIVSAFQQLRGEQIFDRLFGQAFRDLQDQIDGTTPVKDASQKMAAAIATTLKPLESLGNAAAAAADRLSSAGAGAYDSGGLTSSLAQQLKPEAERVIADNPDLFPEQELQEIVVTGAREQKDAVQKFRSAVDTFGDFGEKIGTNLDSTFKKLTGLDDGGVFGSIGKQLGKGLAGYKTGETVNAIDKQLGISKALGLKSSKTGSEIGGALGSLSGIPGGDIIGSIAGSVIGGLFKKTQKSSATLSFVNGDLAVGSVTGSSAKTKAAASAEAGSVVSGLQQIADALGGTLTGAGSVSIGTRKKKFVVDTTGAGRTKGSGVEKFDTQEEAIQAAIADALTDGVVAGISAASKKILASGQDLSKAIEKASLIEAVPKDLKAMLDPVGAAIDDLNTKFAKTVAALKEGGATADQMAQAQQLYDLQLAQVKASTASASQSLKDFLTALKSGSDSPLSLRDQESTAKATLQPYLDQIAAGQTIDQTKYQTAAQAFLDVERELYGSTDAYFAAFDKIQAATTQAIEKIDNAVPITAAVADPFASATADATKATAAATQASAEIAAQQTTLLQQIAAAVGASNASTNSFASGLAARGFAL